MVNKDSETEKEDSSTNFQFNENNYNFPVSLAALAPSSDGIDKPQQMLRWSKLFSWLGVWIILGAEKLPWKTCVVVLVAVALNFLLCWRCEME